VKDSDASLGEIIYSLTSIDSGSNINWDFAGSCKAAPPDDPPDDPEDDLPDDPDDDEEDDRDDSDNDEGDDLDGSGSEDDSSDQGGETSTLDDLISSLPITGPEILFTIFIIVGITCLSIVVKRTIKKYNSSKLP
jgi:hypothetical protein